MSSYLTYLNFQPEILDSSFCNINDYLSCSSVNKSSFSKLFGIPVALLGVLGYILLTIFSFEKIKYSNYLLFYSSLGATLFMIYLTIAELFIIKAVCINCIFVFIVTILIFILAAKKFGKESIKLITNHIE
ncbi:vitamin K epoxide reductase family protein [Candidatus Woesearchaeota archaeon]|nr:vitamin K epoxide reductase family protein [Candidatus Woesearchaeota archaeon]